MGSRRAVLGNLSITFALIVAAAGCGRSVAGVDLLVLPSGASLAVGDTMRVYVAGANAPSGVRWSSAAPGVASVDDSGLVTGVSPGVALIRATSGHSTGTDAVTVIDGHYAARRTVANAMAGSWTEIAPPGFSVPRGIAMKMSLSASDTTLAGSGTYSTTGGSGTAKVTGYVFWQDSVLAPTGAIYPAHPVVVLDLALDDGLSAHIDQAVFLQPDTLSGVLAFSDDASHAYSVSFARVVH